jgi:hypothetical protein
MKIPPPPYLYSFYKKHQEEEAYSIKHKEKGLSEKSEVITRNYKSVKQILSFPNK